MLAMLFLTMQLVPVADDAAQVKDYPQKIVGNWRESKLVGGLATFTAEGKYEYTDPAGKKSAAKTTYRIEDDTLTLRSENTSDEVRYKILRLNDSRLVLRPVVKDRDVAVKLEVYRREEK